MMLQTLSQQCSLCAARLRGCKEWRNIVPPSAPVKRLLSACIPLKVCSGVVEGGGVRLVEGAAVLGVESSCDDTGVGVVEVSGKVMGEALHSQIKVHLATGGIVPNVAAELHKENLARVTELALERSRMEVGDMAAIAVTTGPGLGPCLHAGVQFAKELARKASKPLVSVHHMEAHALTPRIEHDIPFPYLVLLVSGGHCILALAHGPGRFSRLGQTGDDSPGEAFDKVARWLCLNSHPDVSGLSGGAALEVMAGRGDPERFPLPLVMTRKQCCNFSFAGLKTAARKIIAKVAIETGWDELSPLPGCEDIAASFQEAVCRHLLARTHRAILFCQTWAPSVRHLVVSGGVASNRYLRSQLSSLASSYNLALHVPPPRLCTDNGIMIAWAAIEHLKAGGVVSCLESLDYRQKWPLGVDVSQEVEDARIKLPRAHKVIMESIRN